MAGGCAYETLRQGLAIMTRNRRFKSLVRARAARTGESYTSAFRHLRKTDPRTNGDDGAVAPSLRIAVAQSPLFKHLSDRAGLAEHGERLRSLMRAARDADAEFIQFPETSLFQPDKRALSSCGPTKIGLSDWSRVDWFALQDESAKLRAEAKGLLVDGHRPASSHTRLTASLQQPFRCFGYRRSRGSL